MHFCADEARMLAMMIPFLGIGLVWLRAKLPKIKLRFWR